MDVPDESRKALNSNVETGIDRGNIHQIMFGITLIQCVS